MAILNYAEYDHIPVVVMGFWTQTIRKWHSEGYLTDEDVEMFFAGNDRPILAKLGFDFNWENTFVRTNTRLFPEFEPKIIEHFPDGSRSVRNRDGITVLEVDGAVSIPAEIDHLLKDRKSWEKYYLPRLQFNMKRIQDSAVTIGEKKVPFEAVGREHLAEHGRSDKIYHVLHCGSMIGFIRNLTGVEGLSYIYADDESLLDEIINTVGNLTYQCAEDILRRGARFDMAHFWEDICFKSGPLVIPSMFDEKCGPHYKRITALLNDYGIDIISLDCDGMVDSLIPTWINNGINTMFPIEVGTWNASIGKWRKKYGNKIRGVGGMDKRVFALDKTAVDHEIERLKPFVELGGYIPMPDHHIAPDAHWENVVYYCDRMHSAFC
jgi:uroporphyrinogen decarboxylase